MILFIKNIPDNSSHSDIRTFITPAVEGGFLKKKGNLSKLEILVFKEKNTKLVEYHALAYVEPENVALRVIKSLHGAFLKGNRITVRQFYVRNPSNDRRNNEDAAITKSLATVREKRNGSDRRRDLETYMVARPQFA